MRTTVDLPDELLKKAKMQAIEEGITLKELFTRSLEKELRSSNKKIKDREMPWKILSGSGRIVDYEPGDSAFDE